MRNVRRRRPSLLERASHGAERLEAHAFVLGLGVLAVVAVITYLSVIAINGVPLSNPYQVRVETPPDAPLLKDGDEVRIGGQRAGQVRGVRIGGSGGAELDVDIDDGPIGRDARATVRLRGVAGATYVEIDPGDVSDPLPENSLLPRTRTRSGVELIDVVSAFDPTTVAAVRRTLGAYGNGLVGRGADLGRALGDLDPALRTTTPLLEAVTRPTGELAGLLQGVRRTLRGVAPPGATDLSDLLPPAARTLETTARHRGAIQDTIDGVAPLGATAARVLPATDALLTDLTRASRDLAPMAGSLRRALPQVARLLREGHTLRSVRTLARAARPALAAATPVLREVTASAASLAPLADPLQRLSAHLARYERDLFLAPHGFTEWGRFRYDLGQARGARAVRFLPVFTCMRARVPYPEPGEALTHSEGCTP